MTSHSETLFVSATSVAETYAGLPGLRMALVTGSLARGIADDSSDIDLHLYWDRADGAPLLAEPRARAAGAALVFALPTEHGCFEKYRIDDRYVDVESLAIDVLDRAASSLDDAAPLRTGVAKVAAGIRDATALVGGDELRAWRSRFVMSDAVAAAEVHARAPRLLSVRALHDLTAARGDVLGYSARASAVLLDAVGILAAAQRAFVPVDDPKWMPWHLGRLALRPARTVERIDAALRSPDVDTTDDVDRLIVDILDLADRHIPGVDSRRARFALAMRPRP